MRSRLSLSWALPPVCDVNPSFCPRDADAYIRRHPSSIALTLALPVALVFGALNPVAAQQPAPTATALPATPAPTVAPPTPTAAPPAPTVAPPAPTVALPTPEPTLTVPEAIDRILSGEKPVETLVTLFAQRPPLQIAGLLVMALLVAGVRRCQALARALLSLV
jgi:hypothetical protein